MPLQIRSRRILIVSWLFTIVPFVLAVALLADALPGHGTDMQWPAHARFHAVWGAFMFLALAILTALIARNAFASGQRWSWWALAAYTAVGIGSMFGTMLWQAGGGPPTRPLLMVTVMTVALILGLIITAQDMIPRNSDVAQA